MTMMNDWFGGIFGTVGACSQSVQTGTKNNPDLPGNYKLHISGRWVKTSKYARCFHQTMVGVSDFLPGDILFAVGVVSESNDV
jgi:hypothetical protein